MKTIKMIVSVFAVLAFNLYAEEPEFDINHILVKSYVQWYLGNDISKEAIKIIQKQRDFTGFVDAVTQKGTTVVVSASIVPLKAYLGKSLDEWNSKGGGSVLEMQEFKGVIVNGMTLASFADNTYALVPEKVREAPAFVARGPIHNLFELGKIFREHGGVTVEEGKLLRQRADQEVEDLRKKEATERFKKKQEERANEWAANHGKGGKNAVKSSYTPLGGGNTNRPSGYHALGQ
jgi:hypothetical protein